MFQIPEHRKGIVHVVYLLRRFIQMLPSSIIVSQFYGELSLVYFLTARLVSEIVESIEVILRLIDFSFV